MPNHNLNPILRPHPANLFPNPLCNALRNSNTAMRPRRTTHRYTSLSTSMLDEHSQLLYRVLYLLPRPRVSQYLALHYFSDAGVAFTDDSRRYDERARVDGVQQRYPQWKVSVEEARESLRCWRAVGGEGEEVYCRHGGYGMFGNGAGGCCCCGFADVVHHG